MLRALGTSVFSSGFDDSPAFLGGASGKALFLYELSKVDSAILSHCQIDQLLNDIALSASSARSLSFGTGAAGIGTLFEHILRQEDHGHDGSFNRNTDLIIAEQLSSPDAFPESEYVTGLAGLLIYASRRSYCGSGKALLEAVIKCLFSRLSTTGDGYISWPGTPKAMYRRSKHTASGEPVFNLGLAHGVPGIINALLSAMSVSEPQPGRQKLLYQTVVWLFEQQKDPRIDGTYYSYESTANEYTRLGWCYGDLSVAICLGRAGVYFSDKKIYEAGRQAALRSAERSMHKSVEIRDTHICHGAAGLVLLFSSLNDIYRESSLECAAQYWMNFIADRFIRSGCEGFRAWKLTGPDGRYGYTENFGFLEGLSGIGLTILACHWGVDNWLDLVLLDEPPTLDQ